MNLKKAQIQLGESIFVVIIIILIIVLGIVFSSQAQKDEYEQRAETFTNLDSVMLGQFATSLTELQCSTLQVEELSCFDLHKILAFQKLQETNNDQSAQYYYSQLGDANITLELIYPEEKFIQIYLNELNLGNISGVPIQPQEKPIIIPVSIYDDLKQEYYFGVLHITMYSP